MKITKNYLKQVIKEEINKLQNEGALGASGAYAQEPDPDRFKNPFDRFLGSDVPSKTKKTSEPVVIPKQTSQTATPSSTDAKENFKKNFIKTMSGNPSEEERNRLLRLANAHGLGEWANQWIEQRQKSDDFYRYGGFYENKNKRR